MRVIERISLDIDGESVTVERMEDGTFRKPDYLIGAERKVTGVRTDADGRTRGTEPHSATVYERETCYGQDKRPASQIKALTAPATEEAKKWDGWGTAMKPAWEVILVFRKPLSEPSVARNVLKHGTGGLNIDAARVGHANASDLATSQAKNPGRTDAVTSGVYGKDRPQQRVNASGRFPSNVLLSHHESCVPVGRRRVRGNGAHPAKTSKNLVYGVLGGYGDGTRRQMADPDGFEEVQAYECARDEEGRYICPVALLDEQGKAAGVHGAGKKRGGQGVKTGRNGSMFAGDYEGNGTRYGDGGSNCSRFFKVFDGEPPGHPPFLYKSKASRAERNKGLEGMPERHTTACYENGNGLSGRTNINGEWVNTEAPRKPKANHHPTVKPVKLLEWLLKLVVPPDGTVLDPFLGSGTTLVAAANLGMDAIGIEKEAEYAEIARRRIAHAEEEAATRLPIA